MMVITIAITVQQKQLHHQKHVFFKIILKDQMTWFMHEINANSVSLYKKFESIKIPCTCTLRVNYISFEQKLLGIYQ